MVRSMFAGVAGLRAHQAKMDIIGNNIANVNTWGYKAGSMSFRDAMYQNTSSGSAGNTETGGIGAVNANQIGYGVTTGAITYDFSTGSMAPSASGLDCMIDGTGFFIVGPMLDSGALSLDGEDAVKSSGLYLSRVGKFKVDPNGYLTDDSGNYVYGFSYNQDSKEYTTGALVPLQIPTQAVVNKMSTDKNNAAVALRKTELDDANATYNKMSAELSAARQEYVIAQTKYQNLYDTIVGTDPSLVGIDALEKDLTNKNSAMVTAYNAWKDAETDPGNTLRDAYYVTLDSYEKANYELIQLKAQLKAPVTLGTYTAAAKTLDSYFTDYQDALTDVRNGVAGAQATLDTAKAALLNVQNDLSTLEDDSLQGKRDAAKIKVSTAEAKLDLAEKGVTQAEANLKSAQEAAASTGTDNKNTEDSLGEFSSYKIQQDGTIVGTSGTTTVTIGKIALGNVQNTGGLEKDSGYYYTVGASAGNVSVAEANGSDARIMGNYLEMAKVDLATEMTDMITTQRGFQANSKIITVTDQMLEELVNMKR